MDSSEAAFFVGEYITRQWLSKIGYRFDANTLDVISAEAFVTIGVELQRLEGENGGQGRARTRGTRR